MLLLGVLFSSEDDGVKGDSDVSLEEELDEEEEEGATTSVGVLVVDEVAALSVEVVDVEALVVDVVDEVVDDDVGNVKTPMPLNEHDSTVLNWL